MFVYIYLVLYDLENVWHRLIVVTSDVLNGQCSHSYDFLPKLQSVQGRWSHIQKNFKPLFQRGRYYLLVLHTFLVSSFQHTYKHRKANV